MAFDLNPFDDALKDFFIHGVLPIILYILAFLVLIFAPMRLFFKFLIAAILVLMGLWLMGYLSFDFFEVANIFNGVGVT